MVDRPASSWRLSRVPVRLRVRREVEGRDAPKKASMASVPLSTEARWARGVRVSAGVSCGSWASRSRSGVAGRSKRPKKVGRVEEEATGEDIVREVDQLKAWSG